MSIKIVELGKYTTPKIVEDKREKWVAYGEDNNYYQTLIEAKESPTNSALINGISDMIYGRGLYATDADRKPDEYAAMVQLFSEDLMRKVCDDYYTFGEAAIQVIYSQDRSKIVEVAHMPIQNLRPEKCNEEGDIEAYYYSDDWAKVRKNTELQRIPTFGMSKEGLEVIVIKPYKAGYHYFSPVEYQSGLDYSFVEIELAKFHLSNIHNRFSANMIINFNNGVPEPDQQVIIENKIKNKFTGTEGESVVVSFNDNQDTAATIETVQLNDAHNQYQFISEEAARKIMVSHRVTSPLLFGLPQNGGLGSNADEIKMASTLFDNTVIKPMQQVIIEAVNKILAFNSITLNVVMLTSQPLEFTEVNIEQVDTVTAQEKTGIEDIQDAKVQEELVQKEASYNGAQIASALEIMQNVKGGIITRDQAITFLIQMLQFEPSVANALFSGSSSSIITQMKSQIKLDDTTAQELLDDLEGEEIGDDWELVDIREWSEDNEPIEDWAASKIKEKTNLFKQALAVIKSSPSRSSQLDKSVYKVRYSYEEKYSSNDHRPFCSDMMARTGRGVVYRLEDIDKASRAGINREFGHKGQPYDLFKFKGGVNCGHYWQENLYRLKKKTDGSYVEDKSLSSSTEVESIPKSYRPTPRGRDKAKVAPKDMPNNGHHPSYNK